MPDDKLINTFIDALLKLPASHSKNGRTNLLNSIPLNVVSGLDREESVRGDLETIIKQLEPMGCVSESGQRPLIIMAEYALAQAEGMDLEKTFVNIIKALQKCYGEKAPAEQSEAYDSYDRFIKPDDFNLIYLLKRCKEKIPLHPAFTRIVIVCRSPRLLTYLRIRLIERLRKNIPNSFDYRYFTVKPPIGTVDEVINEIDRLRKNLAAMNMVISVHVDTYSKARHLLNELSERFSGRLDNHLIVIVGIESREGMPENVKLYCPNFNQDDVRDWVGNIVDKCKWSKTLIADWTSLICTECHNKLDFESVYNHICNIKYDFENYSTCEQFHTIIKERLRSYARTCR